MERVSCGEEGGDMDVTFEISLKGTVPAPQPIWKSSGFYLSTACSVMWKREGERDVEKVMFI